MRESNVSLAAVLVEKSLRIDNKCEKNNNEAFLDAMRIIVADDVQEKPQEQEWQGSYGICEVFLKPEKISKNETNMRIRDRIIRSLKNAVKECSFKNLDKNSDGIISENELIRLLWPNGNLWDHFSSHCDASSEDKQQMEGEMVWDIYLQYCNHKESGLKKSDYESFVMDIKRGSVKFRGLWDKLFCLLSEPKPYYSNLKGFLSSFVSIYSDPEKTDQIRDVLMNRPDITAADAVKAMIIKKLEVVLADTRSFISRLEIFYLSEGIGLNDKESLRNKAEGLLLCVQDFIALIDDEKTVDSDFVHLCREKLKEFKGEFYKIVSAANIEEFRLL